MSVAEKTIVITPFTIQADHPRNCDLRIQSIPGCRMRSSLSANKPVVDAKTGEPRIPLDQARHFSMLPPVPGMTLQVNPAKLSYTVSDPLYDDEELADRVVKALNVLRGSKIDKIRGAAPIKGELDAHRMKTLCRELIWWHDEGAVKVVQGTLPTLEQVEQLPGNFLLNPGAQIQNTQPRYEKDFEAWVDQLTRSGG